MLELSEAAIRQLIGQKLSEMEIQQLLAMIATGQATLATGERAVSVGGSANDAVLITGDRNILIQIHQADVSTLQMLKDFLAQYANSEQVTAIASVDELVQQVRSRIYDDIQQLHGTMPLWGVDHWVPLGELFVDVNILEELSSNHRSELEDLWQDFQQNPTYRSLDRIGLGKNRERISGLAVLEKNTNLMVVGKPGSGKTTYLQRVVTECNMGNLQASRIPVLIKLREFVEDGRSLSYSLDRYLEQYWQLTEAEIRLILRQGRSLVLLDGLDEITGEEGKTITKQIRLFARAYPQLQIIVTCRTQSFSGEMDWKSLRFSFVEVADFNEAQVRSFTEHWFKTVIQNEAQGLVKSQEFLDQLFREENEPIQDLVITPILLSLTCAVFYQTGKFYSKRSQLYEEGLELLLEQWDKSREIERDEIYRDLSVERKLELLSHLAVKKFEQEQYVLFEQTEIEIYIAEYLGIGQRESQVVLKAIESQHGLLIKRSSKVWSFSHLTFQEYLVARTFIVSFGIENLTIHLIHRRWREIILMAVSMTPRPNYFLKLINGEVNQSVVHDEKIQQFLDWIYEKARLLKSPYKNSAVRAFYFTLTCNYLFHQLPDFPESNIQFQNFSRLNLPRSIDERIPENRGIYFVDSFYKDMWIDYALLAALEIVSDPNPIFSILFLDLASVLGCARAESQLIGHQNLFKDIDQILERLPKANTLQVLQDWWVASRISWIKELRALLTKHRNIGHSWHFSDSQIQILSQYNYTNELLVDCLNEVVDDINIRKEIEESLLLPIAEIEKREQVE